MKDQQLLPYELVLLDALLVGNDPILEALRKQYRKASLKRRDFTGVGSFSYFDLQEHELKVLPENFHIGDVWFELSDNDSGGEAILFIKNGAIDFLETFVHAGEWPRSIKILKVHYFGGARDLESLRKAWGV